MISVEGYLPFWSFVELYNYIGMMYEIWETTWNIWVKKVLKFKYK